MSYYSSLINIDKKKWKEVLDACDADCVSENDDHLADISLLNTNHAVLFNFSSPQKA